MSTSLSMDQGDLDPTELPDGWLLNYALYPNHFPFPGAFPTSQTSSYPNSGTPGNSLDLENPATLQDMDLSTMGSSNILDDPDMADPLTRFQRNDGPFYAGHSQIETASLSVDTSLPQKFRDPDNASATSSKTHPIDSGYRSHSLASGEEPLAMDQELPGLEDGMKMLHSNRRGSRASSFLSAPSSHPASHSHRHSKSSVGSYSHRAPKRSYDQSNEESVYVCNWENCDESFRLQSDLRKHFLRHERPHKCQHQQCSKAFPTVNDRDRHRRTVHGQIQCGEKAWRCIFTNCRASTKIWYRQDNFQAHVKQHYDTTGADTQAEAKIKDLVKRSEFIIGEGTNSIYVETASTDRQRAGRKPFSNRARSEILTPTDRMSASRSEVFNSSFISPVTPTSSSFTFPNQSTSPSSPIPASSPVVNASHALAAMSPSMVATADLSLIAQPRAGRRSRSISTNRSDRETARLQRRDRSRKPSRMATPPIIVYHGADLDADKDTEMPDCESRLKDIIQQGLNGGVGPAMVALLESRLPRKADQNLQIAQKSRRPSNESDVLSRGRASPDAMYLSAGRSQSNDSRGSRGVSHGPERPRTRADAPTTISSSSAGPVVYNCWKPGCDKFFQKKSALDKHIRRHEKPYACTFDDCPCSKVFGSKNDWKRHESSQHYQPELYRCDKCYQTFKRKEDCRSHGVEYHGLSGEALTKFLKLRKIGANHTESFWCGFCRSIIQLEADQKGVEAWDERYNHIAAHFVPDKDRPSLQCKIDDWLLADGTLTKGQKTSNSNINDGQDTFSGMALDSTNELHHSSPFGMPDRHSEPFSLQTYAPDSDSDSRRIPSASSRRHSASREEVGTVTICCECREYGHTNSHVCCSNEACAHKFCSLCEVTRVP